MDCVNPINLGRTRKSGPLIYREDGLVVPCGKCVACRIAKRREWTLRMYHELEVWDDAQFATLTYSDDYLPVVNGYATLRKRDLQLFCKRLRRRLEPRRIRFFAAGEYGDNTNRPHYHLIIYGLGLMCDDKRVVMDCWPYADWSVDAIRNQSFGMVTPESIEYVAGYINKKLSGPMLDDFVATGREPVFRVMSQGIGRDYCDINAEYIKLQMHCTMRGKHVSMPRYYVNRLEIDTTTIEQHGKDKLSSVIESATGLADLQPEQLRENWQYEDLRSYDDYVISRAKQRKANLEAKMSQKQSKL